MKIALVGSGLISIPPTGYGAIERHIWGLYNQLKKEHDVTIVNTVLGSEYRFALWVSRVLRGSDFDIIHAHTAAVGAVLTYLSDNVVFTSHNPAWKAGGVDMRHRWGLGLERFIAAKAAAFIVLDSQSFHSTYSYSNNLHLVHGGIDVDEWEVSSLDGGYVLSVGKIDRKKGYHKIAEYLDDRLIYIIAGKSLGDEKYERHLQELEVQLHLNPSNEEISKLYSQASVYVQPSDFDAFSLAVLEAMASGLPIVASIACKDQVEDGVNGFLVFDEDYIGRIRDILESPRMQHNMGKNSRRLVEDNFSWDIIADKIVEVYGGVT